MVPVDYQLERWVNASAGVNSALDAVMVALAAGAEVGFIALVAAWFVVGVVRRQRNEWLAAMFALLASGLALVVNVAISHAWYRPRPFVDHPRTVHVLLGHVRDASFPSDHVAAALAISIVLLSAHRRLGIVAIVVAVLVGYARVYVGDHYPTDVLAGALVGTLSALVVLFLNGKLGATRFSLSGLGEKGPGTGPSRARRSPGQAGR